MTDNSQLYTPTNARYILRQGKSHLADAHQLWKKDRYATGDIANQTHSNPGRAYLYGAEQCLSVLESTSFGAMIDVEEINGFGIAVRKFKESKAPAPVYAPATSKTDQLAPLAKSTTNLKPVTSKASAPKSK